LFLPFLSAGAFSAQEIAIQAGTIILDGYPFHQKTFVESTLIIGMVLNKKSKSLYFSHITNDE